ncbi:MAG: hypothetical protein ACO1SX_19500 [Actinomycetota bacterium]
MKPETAPSRVLLAAAICTLLVLQNELPAHAAGAKLNGVAVPTFSTQTLPAADFAKLHRGVAPGKERWAEIPWETDLAAARARSAREGKPLLMWVMDGHPLGCT